MPQANYAPPFGQQTPQYRTPGINRSQLLAQMLAESPQSGPAPPAAAMANALAQMLKAYGMKQYGDRLDARDAKFGQDVATAHAPLVTPEASGAPTAPGWDAGLTGPTRPESSRQKTQAEVFASLLGSGNPDVQRAYGPAYLQNMATADQRTFTAGEAEKGRAFTGQQNTLNRDAQVQAASATRAEAAQRQNDQQAFTAGENEKNRANARGVAGIRATTSADKDERGKTIRERYTNTVLNGDPSTPEYGAAFAYLAKPVLAPDPNTGSFIAQTPDMSWARPPQRGGGGAAQNIPGMSPPAPGQPEVTEVPGRGVSAPRATYDANVNQAQADIGVAEKLLFPEGKFNRAMAATGSLPFSKGREAQQAIGRAVEIILRLRTGAAAPVEEVNKYTSMYGPSALDSEQSAATKIQRLREFFEDSKSAAASKVGGAGAAPSAPRVIDFNELP